MTPFSQPMPQGRGLPSDHENLFKFFEVTLCPLRYALCHFLCNDKSGLLEEILNLKPIKLFVVSINRRIHFHYRISVAWHQFRQFPEAFCNLLFLQKMKFFPSPS